MSCLFSWKNILEIRTILYFETNGLESCVCLSKQSIFDFQQPPPPPPKKKKREKREGIIMESH